MRRQRCIDVTCRVVVYDLFRYLPLKHDEEEAVKVCSSAVSAYLVCKPRCSFLINLAVSKCIFAARNEASCEVHEMLIVLVLEQHAELLGKDYAHLPKVRSCASREHVL